MAGTVGNVLEWYDFGVYGFLAIILAKQFFPSSNEYTSLLATFGAFGVGFLARPLGSVVLGAVADRAGRKKVLTLTVLMMAGSTVVIGLMPSFASIGLWAPILVVIARFLQGFSAGGEWGSASAFLVEWADRGKRGLYGSFHQASVGAGLGLASAVAAVTACTMSTQSMQEWGWRIPFMLGGLLGPFGLYIRARIDESPTFSSRKPAERSLSVSRCVLLVTHVFAVAILWGVGAYLVTVYMPTFAQRYASISRSDALWGSSLALLVYTVVSPLSGALSDRFGRKPLLMLSCLFFIVFSWPLYRMLVSGVGTTTFLSIQVLMAVMFTLFAGSGPTTLSEMVPTEFRATGVSIGGSLAAMMGGLTPMFVTWLAQATGSPSSTGILLSASALVSLIGIILMKDRSRESL